MAVGWGDGRFDDLALGGFELLSRVVRPSQLRVAVVEADMEVGHREGGIATESRWGSVEYLTRPEYALEFVSRMRPEGGEIPDSYQAILHVRLKGRIPGAVSHFTHRMIQQPWRHAPPSW